MEVKLFRLAVLPPDDANPARHRVRAARYGGTLVAAASHERRKAARAP